MDAPTKKNLIVAKKSLNLARRGHDLLEKKYFALIREAKRAEKKVRELQEKLREMTPDSGREIFWPMKDSPVDFPPYNLDETGVAFDSAFFSWREVFAQEEELAEAEKRLTELIDRARRTKKRAAALENVLIPRHRRRVKYISERLEEYERDELVRVKTARK
ncbi:MAG: V-type ATP synthase subunit D [Defluviitaleaceae bacterium]|nr:V-type ATP synthase subunit D [Defluviitaleaceae bacterium]